MSSRPRRAQYTRVSESPASASEDAASHSSRSKSTRVKARTARAARAELYAVKMHAALWVAAAVATVVYTDFFTVARTSPDVNRLWLNLGLFLFVTAACLVLYMAIYVPRVLKCDLDPSVYSPKMLPVTGAISLLSGLFLLIGLWPAFGLFTPAVLGVIWIGAIMSAHFLPSV